MSEHELAIKTDEIGVYHRLDANGRMKCTGYKPENLEVVEKADTIGMELCDGCKGNK